jgi:sugar/nucleoside kinase (ribokinase family)
VRLAENSAGLHVGLLGMVLAPGAEQVRRLVEAVSSAGDVVISYDPNVQASVTPDGRGSAVIAGRMAALAHIVKMSDEDLAFLFPQPAGRARRCRPAVNANAGGVRNLRWGRAAPDRRSGNGRRGADLCAPGGPTRRPRRSSGVSRRTRVRPADGSAPTPRRYNRWLGRLRDRRSAGYWCPAPGQAAARA